MELLTLREVAATVKKTERGVRKDISAGRFGPEVLRLGRSVRVRAAEVTAWVLAGCPGRDKWTAERDGKKKTSAAWWANP